MAKGPKEIRVGADGFWLDPNTDTAPQGALLAAHNVVYTKTGGVRPRGAFVTDSSTQLENDISDLDGNDGYSSNTGLVLPVPGDTSYTLLGSGGYSNIDSSTDTDRTLTTEQSTGVHNFATTEQRYISLSNYTYFLSDKGIQETDNVNAFRKAGVPWAYGDTDSGTGDSNWTLTASTELAWLATGNSVAYKFVYGRSDNQGRPLLGAPSWRMVVSNTAGADRYVAGQVPLHKELEANVHYVQVYRTAATSSTPDEEYRLVFEKTITSTDVSNKYVSFEDITPDAVRGAFLYTNPSQGGALLANYQPPVADDILQYNTRVFYSKAQDHRTIITNVPAASYITTAATLPSSDVLEEALTAGLNAFKKAEFTAAYHPTDADKIRLTDASSTTWSDMEDAEDFVVDDAAGSDIPSGSYITAVTTVNATTYDITLNQDHSGTASAAVSGGLSVRGGMKLSDGSAIQVYSPAYSTWASNISTGEFADFDTLKWLAQGLCKNINADQGKYEAFWIGDAFNPGQILLRVIDKSDETGFVAIGGSAEGPVPAEGFLGFDPGVGAYWGYEQYEPSALYFSEPFQPGAVPLVNAIYVGDSSEKILRVAKAGSSLFIFKTDGLFVLRGTGPSDFYLRQVDKDLVLIDPRSLAMGSGSIFCLTTRGFVQVNESGIQEIGQPLYEYGRLSHRSLASLGAVYFTRLNAYIVPYSTTDYDPTVYSITDSVKALVFYTDQRKWATWGLPDNTKKLVVVPTLHPGFDPTDNSNADTNNLFCIVSTGSGGSEVNEAHYYTENSYADTAVYWQQFLGSDPGSAKLFDTISLSMSENELTSLTLRTFGDYAYSAGLSSQSQAIASPDNRRFVTTLVPRDHRVSTRLLAGMETAGYYNLDLLIASYQPLQGFIRR